MAGPMRTKPGLPFGLRQAGDHEFIVSLAVDDGPDVSIIERRQHNKGGSAQPAETIKAYLPRGHWLIIATRIKSGFNRRLSEQKLPIGGWDPGENRLTVHLGWELTLLFWALEGADDSGIEQIFGNWERLAPEERWWLYHIINTTSWRYDLNPNQGWRKAIRIALAETPLRENGSESSFKE
jgi:hypothetical protein